MKHSHFSRFPRRKISLLLHRWHRRIGVLASLFVIWMVVSGWLLNHTATLNLARRMIHSPLLAQHYGLRNEESQVAFSAATHWLVHTQDTLLLDAKKIDVQPSQLVGMVGSHDLLFIAAPTQILLLTPDGNLVDKLSGSALPLAHIEKIGNGCDGAAISDGEKAFVTRDGISWEICGDAIAWTQPQPLTTTQQQIIEPLLQPGISFERLLQDLHSGRFLGRWGPYFIDAVGFGLLLLALSGLWMFSHQRNTHRRAKRERIH